MYNFTIFYVDKIYVKQNAYVFTKSDIFPGNDLHARWLFNMICHKKNKYFGKTATQKVSSREKLFKVHGMD